MSDPADKGLRAARPARDLEDDRVRAAVASRLFGRRKRVEIGRFVVRERLGSGAMGVVYEAYDPKLDRKVALKVLDAKVDDGNGVEARSLREARAAAKLSHPHVVAVHDAGAHEGRVWVAMELVRGGTLRDWLEERDRGWTEIVEMFRQVGEGLAAAHHAGLVHRDFKPENVLVGRDERTERLRARVVDFGLARDLSAELRESDLGVDPLTSSGEVEVPLTRTGIIAGTPAYMAPEQFDGSRVDARADQFAFFVAMYEALFGVRPYGGTTVAALRERMIAGKLEAGNGRRIPRWLGALIRRGLEQEPSRRHASMEEVVAELGRRPSQRRRRLAAGAAGLALGGLGLGWALSPAPAVADPCAGAAAPAADVWNGERRQALREHIIGTELEYAAATAEEVVGTIDRYLEAWSEARVDACRVARVQGRQSQTLHDLRDACLDRRLSEVDALLRALSASKPEKLAHAGQAAAGLTSLALCSNTEALTREVAPPPEHAAEVAQLREQIGELRALALVGEAEEGLVQIAPIVERAMAIDHAPTLAEAWLVEASFHDRLGAPILAEPLARRALHEGVSGRSDDVSIRAALRLAWILGRQLGRLEEADGWLELAAAMIESIGGHDELEATRLGYAGVVAVMRGNAVRGEQLARAALALRESRPELRQHTWLNLVNLGNALLRQRRYDEALEAMRRARAQLVEVRGPDHPDIGGVLNNIGAVLQEAGRHEEAKSTFLEALAFKQRIYGERHPEVASTLLNLSNVYYSLDDVVRSTEALERAVAIRTEALGEESPRLANPLYTLGLNLQLLDKHEEALEAFDKSRRLWIEREGEGSTMAGACDFDAARSLIARERFAEARTHLERAVGSLELPEAQPDEVAKARFLLAKELIRSGGDRKRARKLAAEAAAICDEPEAQCDPAPMVALANGD